MSEATDVATYGDLTHEEQAAAELMLAGQSARVAWAKVSGVTTRRAAYDFHRKGHVQMYLAVRRMEIRAKAGVTESDWVDQVAAIAYLDIAEVAADPPKNPKALARLPEHIRRCVQGWKWDRHGNFVIEFVSKKAALDMLGKFMGVYQKDRTNDADVGADLLKAAFWKYVISMHVGTGVTVAEAIMDARNNPDEVEKWAKAQGLLASGEIVV